MARGTGNAPTSEGTSVEGSTTPQGGEPSTDTQKKVRANRSYIVVPMPGDLKPRFEAEAKAADKPVGPYVLGLLAQALGIEIPQVTVARRSKYASDEERKAAQKARNQNRSGTMRDLMAAFREAQKSGKSPEEAAAIASQKIADLLKNGPSAQPTTNGASGEEAASEPAEAQPATA